MDLTNLYQTLGFVREFLVVILVFAALFAYAIIRGKQALMSLIFGLYMAFLISLEFPYYENIFNLTTREGNIVPILTIVVFAIFVGICAVLFEHLLSDRYRESAFEGVGQKALLALLSTLLIVAFSFHVLPVTSIIDPGSTISTLFAPPTYFFWFLIIPLLGLFFV